MTSLELSDELGPIPVPDKPIKVLKKKWRNRQRLLVLCSRGSSHRDRHLMNDFKSFLPHARGESKIEKTNSLKMVNDICEMNNCNKCMYFESRKRKDTYLWLSNIEGGPSAKFYLRNIHTTGELRLTGNCLKGSRAILSFDKAFDSEPHLALLKELFTQIYGTPAFHPKCQPFFDHVFTFSIVDKKIWFRNYQIVDQKENKLEEIGPRMVMELIKVFDGSFGGPVLYNNADFQNPNLIRRQMRQAGGLKYLNRMQNKAGLEIQRLKMGETFQTDPTDEIFNTNMDVDGEDHDESPDEDEEEEDDDDETDSSDE